MDQPTSPYSVVLYGPDGRVQRSLSVAHTGDDLAAIWDATRLALPTDAVAFALYDRRGELARLGVLPPEPLTDDADVTAIAMDASGRWLATGHADGDLRLWEVGSPDPVWTRAPADEPIAGLIFLDRPSLLIAWSDEGPLLVFTPASGDLVLRLGGPQQGPYTVAVAPDGSEVAFTGMRVTRFTLPGGEPRVPLDDALGRGALPAHQAAQIAAENQQALDEGVVWLAYAPDGRTIVGVRSCESSDEIVFWDRSSGERLTALQVEHGIGACDLSPNGEIAAMALVTDPVIVLLVDIRGRAIAHTVETSGEGVYDLRFAPDGKTVIVHVAGPGVVLIDTDAGRIRATLPEDDASAPMMPQEKSIVPDEVESPPIMVTHNRQGTLELTPLSPRTPFGPVGRTTSANGRRYATVPYSADNNLVTVYDLERGRSIATLAHRANVQEIWISPDGAHIAVRAAGQVTLWPAPEPSIR